jgi:hypothetical protein
MLLSFSLAYVVVFSFGLCCCLFLWLMIMKSIVFHNREKIFSVSKYLSSNASSLFGKSRGHKSAFYEESMYLEIRFEVEICDSN